MRRINSRAGLGTLALSGEMNNIQLSVAISGGRKTTQRSSLEYEGSLNVCMDSTFGRLTENDSRQNVVQLNVQKSHLFVSLRSLTLNNLVAAFAHIGHINIDVPLRPMIVHGVVYRESKVIEQKILPEIKNFGIFEEEKAAAAAATAAGAAGTPGATNNAGNQQTTQQGASGQSSSTQQGGSTGSTSLAHQQAGSSVAAATTTTTAHVGNATGSGGHVGLSQTRRDRIDTAGGRLAASAQARSKPPPMVINTRVEIIDENETLYSG